MDIQKLPSGRKRNKPEVLAIIPARGGSKGLPCKNIAPLDGKPLVAYTIETALAAKNITRVVVSTDSRDIAEVAKAYGAEVPFIRPKELSGDAAETESTVIHAKEFLYDKEGYLPVAHCLMYPTTPFRRVCFVEDLVAGLLNNKFSCAVEVISTDEFGFLHVSESGEVLTLNNHNMVHHAYYQRVSGYFYGMNVISEASTMYVKEIKNKYSKLDIDYLEDLAYAERVLKQRKFTF